MTGSPAITSNPAEGTVTVRENAEALMRWQPVQWHAEVRRGGALMCSRTCPQRQPPAQGRPQ
jgi:hypothetical protein